MHYLLAAAATAAAIPLTIFCWMMAVAAMALLTNGESPRAVLAMPRTIVRGGTIAVHPGMSED